MNLTAHILHKDVRRLRWTLVVLFVLVAARLLVETVGVDVALMGRGPLVAITQISELLSLTYGLFFPFLVSRLIHDEPLVGREAFWLTRPISPVALMGAKLVFAALFLLALPLAANLIVPAVFGMPVGDVGRIIPVFGLNQVLLILALIALATVTPSLVRYVLALVGIMGAFVVLMALLVFTALFMRDIQESGDVRWPDHTPEVVAAMCLILTATAMIVSQYRSRRVTRALVIAGIGAAIACVIVEFWNGPSAGAPHFETTAGPPDTPSLMIALDGNKPRVTDDSFGIRHQSPVKKTISVPADVRGVPAEFNVHRIVARSRLELPGGVVLETGGRNATRRWWASAEGAPLDANRPWNTRSAAYDC